MIFSELVISVACSPVVTYMLVLKALIDTDDLLLVVDLVGHFLPVGADAIVEAGIVPRILNLLLLLQQLLSNRLKILHITVILLIDFFGLEGILLQLIFSEGILVT